MARPSKTRRVFKWTGTVVTLLLLMGFVGSYRYRIHLAIPNGDGTTGYGLSSDGGVIWPERLDLNSGWKYLSFSDTTQHVPDLYDLRLGIDLAAPLGIWMFPLWIPLMVVAVPTVVAWRLDRQQRPTSRWNALDVITVIVFAALVGLVSLVVGDLSGLAEYLRTLMRWDRLLSLPTQIVLMGSGAAGCVLGGLVTIRWTGRRAPAADGHCQTCGYNLTGNVSGVCPECGTPTAQSTARRRGPQHPNSAR